MRTFLTVDELAECTGTSIEEIKERTHSDLAPFIEDLCFYVPPIFNVAVLQLFEKPAWCTWVEIVERAQKNTKLVTNFDVVMTRDEMIEFIKANPGVTVTHELFDANEYIYSTGYRVYDENGYLFEDWYSPFHNGIRMRTGGNWEQGWTLYNP